MKKRYLTALVLTLLSNQVIAGSCDTDTPPCIQGCRGVITSVSNEPNEMSKISVTVKTAEGRFRLCGGIDMDMVLVDDPVVGTAIRYINNYQDESVWMSEAVLPATSSK